MSSDSTYREGFIDALNAVADMIQQKGNHEIFTKHYFSIELLKEIDKIRFETRQPKEKRDV
jgi:hypothetical protein